MDEEKELLKNVEDMNKAKAMDGMNTIILSREELDELSQFLYWIEDRVVVGDPWWPGEDNTIYFSNISKALHDAVEEVHSAWERMRGLKRRGVPKTLEVPGEDWWRLLRAVGNAINDSRPISIELVDAYDALMAASGHKGGL